MGKMRTQKRIILSFVLGLSLVMSSSMTFNVKASEVSNASSASEVKKGYPVTITTYDGNGEPIEEVFTEAPKRVVAVYQSAIETLLALGQGDKIVLAAMLDTPVKDEYREQFDKIKYQEKAPTKEEVLGAEPDFITSWTSYFGEKTLGSAKDWIGKGINTYVQTNSGALKPNTLQNEYNDIINMGRIFDVEDKALSIVENMKSEIKKAADHVAGKEKVKTAIIEINRDGQYRVYGSDSIGGDIAQQVGAELVADKNGTIGKEDLMNLNPDVIFVVYFGNEMTGETEVSKITDDASFKNLEAVKNGRVLPIVLSEVYATGVRTLDGIKTITKGLYPDLQ